MKRAKSNLSFWNWTLFFSVLFYMLVPSIYKSYSIYLIGNTPPSANNLAIVSQWQFVQVFFEIIQEGLVLPIFFFVGAVILKEKAIIKRKIITSFWILFSVLIPLLTILSFFIQNFIQLIDTPQEITLVTSYYLSIKIWTLLFSIANMGLVIIIETLKKNGVLIVLTLIKLILSIFFDSLFFGGYDFSLDFGIEGLAISNLITEALTFVIVLLIVARTLDITISNLFQAPKRSEIQLFGKISLGIGLESLVKNLAYFFLIIKLINSIGAKEISGYYLSMHLYWSFYLLPILAIVEVSNVMIAHHSKNKSNLFQVLKKGLLIVSATIILWTATLFFIQPILQFLSNDSAVIELAKQSFLILFIPYGLMSLNMVANSLFYGTGKTKYLFYKSLITNSTVYFTAYFLYQLEIWQPTFVSILVLFGIGILVGAVLTIYYAYKVLYLEK